MKKRVWFVCLFYISAVGCSSGPAVPNEEQLKRDITGLVIPYSADFLGTLIPYKWDVKDGDIKEIVIQQRFTNRKAGTDEVHALVTLDDSTTVIKGVLVLGYEAFDQGWRLQSIINNENPFNKKIRCRDGVKCKWDEAKAYCGERLPTVAQLQSIYQAECTGGIHDVLRQRRKACDLGSGSCDVELRDDICEKNYWTSEESGSSAQSMYFGDGAVNRRDKVYDYYVRCP